MKIIFLNNIFFIIISFCFGSSINFKQDKLNGKISKIVKIEFTFNIKNNEILEKKKNSINISDYNKDLNLVSTIYTNFNNLNESYSKKIAYKKNIIIENILKHSGDNEQYVYLMDLYGNIIERKYRNTLLEKWYYDKNNNEIKYEKFNEQRQKYYTEILDYNKKNQLEKVTFFDNTKNPVRFIEITYNNLKTNSIIQSNVSGFFTKDLFLYDNSNLIEHKHIYENKNLGYADITITKYQYSKDKKNITKLIYSEENKLNSKEIIFFNSYGNITNITLIRNEKKIEETKYFYDKTGNLSKEVLINYSDNNGKENIYEYVYF